MGGVRQLKQVDNLGQREGCFQGSQANLPILGQRMRTSSKDWTGWVAGSWHR